MLIRAYSDLHGFLPHVQPCDALLIAGDICPIDGEYGGEPSDGDDDLPLRQARFLSEVFMPWCDAMPVEQILLTPGNHDAILAPENRALVRALSDKVTLLIDERVSIGSRGPSVVGQPWIPDLVSWPFYKPDDELRVLAEEIPIADIWMFHVPPCSFDRDYRLDVVDGKHVGNPFISSQIVKKEPQLVICGHVHGRFGIARIGKTPVANVSFIDESCAPRFRHLEIEWNETRREISDIDLVGGGSGHAP